MSETVRREIHWQITSYNICSNQYHNSHALSTNNACWVYHVESVSKMGLVLSINFLQYMGLHVLNWPIRVTHLIIIIISEVSTFPIVVIFFHGCVSKMVILSYSIIYYIYIPGTLGPCLHYWCSVYGICNWQDTIWPVGRVHLIADYPISLSSLCRLIWRHWSAKMLVRYMLSSVCLRFGQFSQLSFIQYMELCVFSLPNSPVMIVRMCTLSYYHHQIGIMNHNHCLGLGHETMIWAVCLTMVL